jgi:DNA-binding transcriptional LysR family regulator
LRDGRVVEVLREARGELVDVSIIRPDRRLTPPRITALLDFLLANPPVLDDLG